MQFEHARDMRKNFFQLHWWQTTISELQINYEGLHCQGIWFEFKSGVGMCSNGAAA